MAITSLIFGILSVTCLWFVGAIPAVICGHIAHSKIKSSAGALSGSGLALAGLITGYISIVLSFFIVPMLIAIAIPNFVKAKTTAMKNVCVHNLQQIEQAKDAWAAKNKNAETDKPTAADLDAFLRVPYSNHICPAGGIYSINPLGEHPTCSTPGHQLP